MPSLAKHGYNLSEYEPEILFHHASPWPLAAKKSSNSNTDEYLVGTPDAAVPSRGLTLSSLSLLSDRTVRQGFFQSGYLIWSDTPGMPQVESPEIC